MHIDMTELDMDGMLHADVIVDSDERVSNKRVGNWLTKKLNLDHVESVERRFDNETGFEFFHVIGL